MFPFVACLPLLFCFDSEKWRVKASPRPFPGGGGGAGVLPEKLGGASRFPKPLPYL